MLQISNRGEAMPASPIRKLVPYAEAAKKRGTTVYHLNIGQPDIETPKQVRDAIKNADFTILEYTHSAGLESYRKKLAGYYKSVGIDVNHNQIIITTGGSEAILFGFMACLDPGDEVIIPEPFYANYNGFAIAAGINVVPVTSTIDDGFALPPLKHWNKKLLLKQKQLLFAIPTILQVIIIVSKKCKS
jgi:aspartate aminotransferase